MRGEKGESGQPGINGVTGSQGPKGLPGSRGQKGETGPQGVTGPKGEKGERGQQGLQGLNGIPGSIGFAGSKGQKGERGQKGFYGLTGPQGPKGERGLRGPPGPTAGGVVYIRWGRTTCPNTTGTHLQYAGRAAGSYNSETGGGANHLCLPEQPQYLTYTAGSQIGRAHLYGVEYRTAGSRDNGPLHSFQHHNVPCAVCYTSTRGTVMMIPARITCPSSWTREYYGYLMANWRGNHARTMFECVDRYPQSVPGSAASSGGDLFYHTEVKCTGIPCPPYDTQKEVTCVVCTK